MKPRRDRNVSLTLLDDVGKEEAAIASACSLSDEGDLALVAAAKNENRQAFEVLVERHARRVFFTARRMTRTREDAEDVAQQSWQKAFTHLRQFEGQSAFSTWLTRIVINEALILLRKCRGRREVLINDSTEGEEGLFVLAIPDSGPNPEDSCSQRERQGILFAALNELPHETRRAIQLRELGERSTEETARIMGISVGALKGRAFHGRRKLRERLKHILEPAWRSARKTSQGTGSTTPISQGQVPCNACG
jgi:RNA polymerase sigma-70 factor (ECF subfamily)